MRRDPHTAHAGWDGMTTRYCRVCSMYRRNLQAFVFSSGNQPTWGSAPLGVHELKGQESKAGACVEEQKQHNDQEPFRDTYIHTYAYSRAAEYKTHPRLWASRYLRALCSHTATAVFVEELAQNRAEGM